ncbi:MAG: GTPase HflX [Ruminococcaceae bacterium]|nr:GTPase HflX [Oscillospiraceae bacterium]
MEDKFKKTITTEKPKCILAAASDGDAEGPGSEFSMNELERLLDTAGGVAEARLVQMRDKPDNATYLGEGKIEELRDLAVSVGAELVVFDDELTPSQIRNIEERLENVRVIDRTMLILDIFAGRAATAEGILQVEIARLKYTMPRLLGKGTELSRLGGGIGTRGPGESKLESDRRHIKRRITALAEDLKELEKKRSEQRKTRKKSGIPQIAVAGYTNAGKSTLLNTLTNAGIFAEDKLFATLDPTTRRLELPEAGEALMTDTVGFIDRLPHHLVEAFRSTLEEVTFADIIVVLLDASDDRVRKHYEVTQSILNDLFEGKERAKTLYVFNKCDKIDVSELYTGLSSMSDAVFISAVTGQGIDDLIKALEKLIKEDRIDVKLSLPMSKGGILSSLYETSYVKNVEYEGAFIKVEAVVDKKTYGSVRMYVAD